MNASPEMGLFDLLVVYVVAPFYAAFLRFFVRIGVFLLVFVILQLLRSGAGPEEE
jgi:hypothetical protein